MKKASVIPFLVPVTLCAALAIYNPGRAEAAFRIVGLPKTGDATQIETMLAGLALGLSPGDSMMVFDSLDGTSIGPTMTIPNDPTKSRPERRIADIIPTMAAVKKHLATMTPAKTGELDLINASAFFDSIAPIVADHSSEVVRILVLGAPSFTAPGQLESDKKYIGSFPSDGLILADRSRSPFGTKGKHDLRATVDYCYTGGQRNFLTPEDRERVERAWSLHIAQRGGQLTTFSGDIKTCFDRFAAQKAPEARKFEFDATGQDGTIGPHSFCERDERGRRALRKAGQEHAPVDEDGRCVDRNPVEGPDRSRPLCPLHGEFALSVLRQPTFAGRQAQLRLSRWNWNGIRNGRSHGTVRRHHQGGGVRQLLQRNRNGVAQGRVRDRIRRRPLQGQFRNSRAHRERRPWSDAHGDHGAALLGQN
jgi:hypothetical protein